MTETKQRRRTLKPPSYRLHKGSGQARVRLNGQEIYLGKFGSAESHLKYAKLIAEYRSAAVMESARPANVTDAVTINELVLAYLKYAGTYYVKNGTATDEYDCIKSAVRPLLRLFGELPANDFGPLKLKAVRQVMIDGKTMCRKFINKSVHRIRRAFRFGVENELVRPDILAAIKAVTPLVAGRCEAIDHPARACVPQANIDRVKAVVPDRTADIMELILLSAARPGEITMLTGAMIDQSHDVWLAKLENHKTAHRGKRRVLLFGPKAQIILKKYLVKNPEHRLFKLSRATVSNQITAACDELEISRYSAHWLRHNAATRIREEFGREIARIILGHATAEMTDEYTHIDIQKGVEVARTAG